MKIPNAVTRSDVRHVRAREEALLDNHRLCRFLEEDVWAPNTEPTMEALAGAAERRGFTVKHLAEEPRGEHVETFLGIYSKRDVLAALIHADHTGVVLVPTDNRA